MLIFSGIYKNAKENNTKICMITENENITYEELKEEIDKKASFFKSKFKIGEKVIIKNINPINTIANILSCSKAGLISIPVDTKMLSDSLNNIIETTKPCSIIEDDFIYDYTKNEKIFYSNIEECLYYNNINTNKVNDNNINRYEINYRNINSDKINHYNINSNEFNNNISSREINPNNIFLGALSSGTTGRNKVIWRDHISWTSAFKYQSEVFHINGEDRLFLVGSLSYTANLNSAMHILNEGGTIVFSKSIYPKTWIKEIEENKATSIFMVPAHYRLLLKELKKNMHNIRSLLSAGAKMDKNTVNLLKERFPKAHICEYYGASELGHITYINFRENFNEDSLGKPFPGVKIWIERIGKSIEDSIRESETNKNIVQVKKLMSNKSYSQIINSSLKDGIIWVESPYIAPKFRPKATVGDIGKIDKEGNLYILGRESGIINKGGVKILPHEVEKILNKHPKINQSIVLGIKDESKGEEVAAVILPKDSKLTTKEVMYYCREHLDLHKRPQKIKIVSNIKLNVNGKIDKKQLIKDVFNISY